MNVLCTLGRPGLAPGNLSGNRGVDFLKGGAGHPGEAFQPSGHSSVAKRPQRSIKPWGCRGLGSLFLKGAWFWLSSWQGRTRGTQAVPHLGRACTGAAPIPSGANPGIWGFLFTPPQPPEPWCSRILSVGTSKSASARWQTGGRGVLSPPMPSPVPLTPQLPLLSPFTDEETEAPESKMTFGVAYGIMWCLEMGLQPAFCVPFPVAASGERAGSPLCHP